MQFFQTCPEDDVQKPHIVLIMKSIVWADLQEVSQQVVDSDPPIQPLFVTWDYGSIVEIKWQRTKILRYISQDSIGPLFTLLAVYRNSRW